MLRLMRLALRVDAENLYVDLIAHGYGVFHLVNPRGSALADVYQAVYAGFEFHKRAEGGDAHHFTE